MNLTEYQVRRLAHEAVQRRLAADNLACDVEAGFIAKTGNLGTHLLALARESAIIALAALPEVDPEEPKEIRRLQNEVKRFQEIASWMMTIAADGKEAWEGLSGEEQEALAELINPNPKSPGDE